VRETRVTVASGRVQVAGRMTGRTDAGPAIVLTAGQSTRVGGAGQGPLVAESDTLGLAMIWREGGFYVPGQPLRSVFAELERRYDVRISTRFGTTGDHPPDLPTLKYARPEGVDSILGDICTMSGLRFRPTSDGYEVYSE
jgi:hypothetical protein